MANKKILKFSWLLLALIGFGSGVRTLTYYKQSTLSMFAGSMQIINAIIILIVVYMFTKKKDNGKSV